MLDMAVITHNGKPMSCVDQLHWLDVPDRVLFKLAVAVHQCLNGRAPPYLSEHCIPVSSVDTRRRLRSANRHLLADRVSGSTLTAVGRSQLLARWPETLFRIVSGIQRAAQTALGVYLKRTCSHVTNASSAKPCLNVEKPATGIGRRCH